MTRSAKPTKPLVSTARRREGPRVVAVDVVVGGTVNPFPVRTPAYPIVAILASTGGLEALLHFPRRVPADCGMVFAAILHLD